jgi:predicted GNAT superfamily acetyltransferase
MYGDDTHSALHGGIGTDRFVVAWDLTRDGGANMPAAASDGGTEGREAPLANALAFGDTKGAGPVTELPDANVVRVEVPADIDSVIARDIASAATLRESTRRVFTHYMDRGYRITGFSHLMPDDRYFYILSRTAS